MSTLTQGFSYGMANDSTFRLIVDHVSMNILLRSHLAHSRGIFTNYLKDADSAAVLAAGAKKQIAYLTRFGKPIHPFQYLYGDLYNN